MIGYKMVISGEGAEGFVWPVFISKFHSPKLTWNPKNHCCFFLGSMFRFHLSAQGCVTCGEKDWWVSLLWAKCRVTKKPVHILRSCLLHQLAIDRSREKNLTKTEATAAEQPR